MRGLSQFVIVIVWALVGAFLFEVWTARGISFGFAVFVTVGAIFVAEVIRKGMWASWLKQ